MRHLCKVARDKEEWHCLQTAWSLLPGGVNPSLGLVVRSCQNEMPVLQSLPWAAPLNMNYKSCRCQNSWSLWNWTHIFTRPNLVGPGERESPTLDRSLSCPSCDQAAGRSTGGSALGRLRNRQALQQVLYFRFVSWNMLNFVPVSVDQSPDGQRFAWWSPAGKPFCWLVAAEWNNPRQFFMHRISIY